MAKGQQRSTKEDRKKKSTEKKDKVPRYLRSTDSNGFASTMAKAAEKK